MSTAVSLAAAAAATTRKGDTWNESMIELDPWTRRRVRCVGRLRAHNVTPGFHTNTAFTSDGETMVFSTTDDQGRIIRLADSYPAAAPTLRVPSPFGRSCAVPSRY